MKRHDKLKRHALASSIIAALSTYAPCALADQPAAAAVPVVVVTASRTEQLSFDLPASIDVIDANAIGAAQPRVNASEALAAVPGLVAQNRQNYAQDLQISSRGFGVRGVRLIADGIPATMPDGQGQAATFDLDMAERIEVLRGPFSALYGNHSGGVVQLFTRDPKGPPAIELNVSSGSYGSHKTDLNAGGSSGKFGYLIDVSRFETDGYRSHSAATRDQAYAKLTFAPSATSRLVLVAGGLRQDDTLERVVHERKLRVHALELGVFLLQLAQLRQVRHRHATVLAPTLVEGGFADAVLAAGLADLGTELDLLEDTDNLAVTESGLLHVETPSRGILYFRLVQDFEETTIGSSARWIARAVPPTPIATTPMAPSSEARASPC